jgi:hypothetical protein
MNVKTNKPEQKLALQDVYDALAREPGGALRYFDLLRAWSGTGSEPQCRTTSIARLIDTFDHREYACADRVTCAR